MLDAVVRYLPNPSEHLPPPLVTENLQRIQQAFRGVGGNEPFLLAFKIIFDPHRGPLTLARIFAGHVTPGMHIRNMSRLDIDDGIAVEKVIIHFGHKRSTYVLISSHVYAPLRLFVDFGASHPPK